MSPAPIDIAYSSPHSPSPSSSYTSSSSHMSSGLYVPVHKRTPSSASSTESSRSPSPTLSTQSDSSEHSLPGVYTPSDLLLLAGSPLARLPLETLTSLRENVPDIMLNRRQRKSQGLASNVGTRGAGGRRRPAGRGSERRAAAGKVVDELNWRGVL